MPAGPAEPAPFNGTCYQPLKAQLQDVVRTAGSLSIVESGVLVSPPPVLAWSTRPFSWCPPSSPPSTPG